MRKPYRFDALSDRKCRLCSKRLKKNLVAKKPDADLCWICFYPQRNPEVAGTAGQTQQAEG